MNPVLDLMAAASAPDSPLTPQQRLVFAEYLTGATDAEISARLRLQLGTVQAHLQAARTRLNDNVPRRLIRAAARATRGEGAQPVAFEAGEQNQQQPAAVPARGGTGGRVRRSRTLGHSAPALPAAPVVLPPAPAMWDADSTEADPGEQGWGEVFARACRMLQAA